MDEVAGRIVELSARTLGSPRASVWFQETAGGEISVRATHGYPELDRERLARLHFDHEPAVAFLEGKEPFVAFAVQFASSAPALLAATLATFPLFCPPTCENAPPT